jgi:hypothetical protein
MDLKGYVASQHDKKSLVDQCEMIEGNETPIKHNQDNDNDNNRNRKKIKFAKSETKNKKVATKLYQTTDSTTARSVVQILPTTASTATSLNV